jgi:PAS domain S-box-containing protein
MSKLAETREQLLGQIEALQARLDELSADETRREDSRGGAADMAQRRLAEAALREAEARFRPACDLNPAMMMIVDVESRTILDVNQAYQRRLGYAKQDVVGVPGKLGFAVADAAARHDVIRSIREKGRLSGYELTLVTSENEEIVVLVFAEPMDQGLHVISWVDITELKQVEACLVASEARFRALVENSHDVINMFNSDGQLLYTSPSIERVLGFSPEEMKKLHPREVMHPEDAERGHQEFRSCLDKPGAVSHFTFRLRHKDGSYRTVEVTGTNLLDEPGIHAMVSIFHDITERKQAQEDLEQSLRFEALLSRISSTLINLPASEIDDAINSGLRLIGEFMHLERAGILMLSDDRTRFSVTHEWCVPGLEPAMEKYQNFPLDSVPWARDHWLRGEAFNVPRTSELPEQAAAELEIAKSLGTQSYISIPIIVDGQVWGMVDFHTVRWEREWPIDLVQQHKLVGEFFANALARKRAESQLRDSATRLHAIFDHHFQLTGLMDCKGRLLAANKTALNFAGADESDVIGRYFWDTPWWDPQQQSTVRHAIQRAAHGEFVRFECTHIRVDGEVRDFDFSLSPVRDVDGNVIYLVPEGRDITDMKRAEEKLADMEARLAHVARLSTMGEMTAGVAHEVSQPLHAIVNLACATGNVLEAEGEPDFDDLREWNAAIAASAQRAADVVRRMRAFARRGESERSICFINEVVRESVQLVGFEARRCGASVGLELPEPSPRVDVDRVQIQQVLVNLLRNALEAMDESEIEVREVTIRVELAAERVEVSVVDTGPGLPARDELAVFEPFSTTKKDGLGLGLPISSSIVEAHGGMLWTESSAAGRAAFRFTLPALPMEATDGG